MCKKCFQCVLLWCLVLTLNASADETAAVKKTFDPAARAATVAPYIDEMTRVIVRVDVERLSIEQGIATIIKILPPEKYNWEADLLRTDLLSLKDTLDKVAAREVYVVGGMEDLSSAPFFILIPLTQDGQSIDEKIEELKSWSKKRKLGRMSLDRLGDFAFIGTPETLKRLQTLKPTPRAELTDAFTAAGDSCVQAILLTGDDDRRVIEELYPQLPELLGGGQSTLVTHGLRWAAVGIDLPPKPRLQLTIQSLDEHSAQALADKINQILSLVSGGKIFGEKTKENAFFADACKLAALLKPTAAGDRIVCDFGNNQSEADTLLNILATSWKESLNVVWRCKTEEKFKQLGLAMHNWHDAHKAFPAQANYDAAGRPLLSWRVHILPYLEENELYKQFHLDEPWDSPHNIKLIDKMPDIYALPNSPAQKQGRTCIVRPAGEKTTCPGKKAVAIKEIEDGTSNTIMLVEVDEKHAVVWTKPDDIEINLEQPLNGLGGHFPGSFLTAICDGSVHFIPVPIKPKWLKNMFTRGGGEPVNWSKIH